MFIQTCNQCLCGGQKYDYCRSCCSNIWTRKFLENLCFWIAAIGIVLVGVGILYLYLIPFSNIVALILFADTKCDEKSGVWIPCRGVTYGPNENYDSDIVILAALAIHFVILLPTIIAFLMFILNCCDKSGSYNSKKGCFHGLSISYLLLGFFVALFTGQLFAVKYLDGCDKYSELAITSGWVVSIYQGGDDWKTYGGMCTPVRALGFNKGAQIDDSLPYNRAGCGACVAKGVLIIFSTIVLPPLIIFFTVLLVKWMFTRWKESKDIVLRGQYDPV